MGQLLQVDFGTPLHSLVICGEIHPLEADVSVSIPCRGHVMQTYPVLIDVSVTPRSSLSRCRVNVDFKIF